MEKNDSRVKMKTCTNKSKQQVWSNENENASPTMSTKALLITSVIDAKEERNIITSDNPKHSYK